MLSKRNRAILYILCSAFFFALMNTFVRLSGDLPSVQKSFFRNLVAAFAALALLLRSREGFRCDPRNLPLLVVRSVFGTMGILCNFYAVDHLLLSDASMLNKLSPFFAILFSRLTLKERIRPYQLAGILIAFGGMLLIVKPGFASAALFPALVGVWGSMSAGAAYTAVRCLGQRGERGPFIVFFFSAFSCGVTLPFLLLDYHPMTGGQLACLLAAGLCAALAQFAVTAAYTNAPARTISVYDYSQVVFSAVLGFFLFGQIPDLWCAAGYSVICGVSVWMFLRGRREPSA